MGSQKLKDLRINFPCCPLLAIKGWPIDPTQVPYIFSVSPVSTQDSLWCGIKSAKKFKRHSETSIKGSVDRLIRIAFGCKQRRDKINLAKEKQNYLNSLRIDSYKRHHNHLSHSSIGIVLRAGKTKISAPSHLSRTNFWISTLESNATRQPPDMCDMINYQTCPILRHHDFLYTNKISGHSQTS